MALAISLPEEVIRQFCESHGIRRMMAFGSVVRDDFGSESDIDILVEFDPDVTIGLLRLARLELDLGEIIGRPVDLSVKGPTRSAFAEAAAGAGELIYAR